MGESVAQIIAPKMPNVSPRVALDCQDKRVSERVQVNASCACNGPARAVKMGLEDE
jgi:hypothetical protein